MTSLQFEIQHRYRAAERLVVDHQRALVGSAAHCEVRLPPEDCPPEWALFELRDGELFVEPLAKLSSPLLEGQQLTRGRLRSGAELQLGSCMVTISVLDPTGGVVKKKETNLRAIVLGGLLLAAAAYAASLTPEQDSSFAVPDNAPALWSAKPAACSQTDPALAAARADELTALADSKRERSPFVPREGVAAVSMYREAAVCLRAAGKVAEAVEVAADSTRLEVSVKQDYHLARLRLERALVTGDGDSALTQISVLKSMLEKQPGEYTAQLNNMERRLLVQFGAKS